MDDSGQVGALTVTERDEVWYRSDLTQFRGALILSVIIVTILTSNSQQKT